MKANFIVKDTFEDGPKPV